MSNNERRDIQQRLYTFNISNPEKQNEYRTLKPSEIIRGKMRKEVEERREARLLEEACKEVWQ